ncbi:MAG: TIR domain-containing protein [Byssovorax sp.]
MPERAPVNVFFCYAPEDEELRRELETHLALLSRQGFVRSWSARRIGAGAEWRGTIDQHLEEAELILLLVSADFLASDYLYDVELARALERHRVERTRLISIILRPCDYATPGSPLRDEVDLVLPTGGRAVTSWPTHDDAFADVTHALRTLLDEEARRANARTAVNPRMAHLPRASGGWATDRRRAKDRSPRSPRRGTCRTGATPRSPGAIRSWQSSAPGSRPRCPARRSAPSAASAA